MLQKLAQDEMASLKVLDGFKEGNHRQQTDVTVGTGHGQPCLTGQQVDH